MLATSSWPELKLLGRVEQGNRNEVWRGAIGRQSVAVRASKRSVASLAWELDLIDYLGSQGFVVPAIVLDRNGNRSANGVVVQRWIEGREPTTTDDWQLVATELQRVHAATAAISQRPDCCTCRQLVDQRTSVDADLDAVPTEVEHAFQQIVSTCSQAEISVIHGDVGPSNIRITDDGRVALLDWDESRRDLTWHDLSPVAVLSPTQQRRAERLSDVWEAVNGWIAEPDYARRRFEQLST